MKTVVQFAFVIIFMSFFPGFAQDNKKEQVDKYINQMLAKYRIPGAAIAVIKNGEIVNKKNYGINSIEFDLPVTDSTIFPLASVTKIFTGTIMMKLAERGVISLTDPITKYVDSLPVTWNFISIKHLLSHTSGIKNHFQTKEWRALGGDGEKYSKRQIIQFSAEEPLMFAAGEKFSYSVTGYILLGMVAEKVSGKTMDVLAKELIFSPLNMSSTHYGDYKTVIKNRNSLVYTYQNGPFETWNFTYGASGTTAAGLNSSTADICKFFTALDGERILTKETMAVMMAPTILNDGTKKNYGLGWVVDENKDTQSFGHEGGGCAWIDYYPSKRLTVVFLCNLTGSKADEIVKGIAGFYL